MFYKTVCPRIQYSRTPANPDRQQESAVPADTVEQHERNTVVAMFVVYVEMDVRPVECAEHFGRSA